MRDIVVYGAGGLAREVEFLIERINAVALTFNFVGFVVTDRNRLGDYDSADKIVGEESWLERFGKTAVALAVGTPQHRVSIGQRLSATIADDRFPSLVDPSAVLDMRSCVLDPGSIVTAGNILTVNIRLRRFSFINLQCTIGHEADIGEGCVLNPSCNISGGVRLESGVLVGTGAQVLQYVTVGANASVGAGAVVNKTVAPGVTVVGIPAKPLQRP